MSYDLMVFENSKAPRTRVEFMNWYDVQTEWSEAHDYQTPSVASLSLQKWYNAMKDIFHPMNGSDAPTDEQFEEDEELEESLADYCIGSDVIYVAFSWSKADEAYKYAKEFAKQYGVGFFDVSNEKGEIIFPDGTTII